MSDLKGVNILEVWDFRLSKASPILYDSGKNWVVKIFAKDGSGLLAEHETDVATTGNPRDPAGVIACYEFLKSIRDDYSLDHIEQRKPVTRLINAANAEASEINGLALAAEIEGDLDLFNQLKGELQAHLLSANAVIKEATKAFHAEVATGGAS